MDSVSIFRNVSRVVSVALVGALAFGQSLQGVLPVDAGARTDRSETADASVEVVFEGFVLGPDGVCAEGAVVVSSAGGRAVTEWNGSFRLEVRVPPDAASVQVTAVGRAGASQVASSTVALSPTSGVVRLDPLVLGAGAECQPHWLSTFGELPGTDGDVHALAVFDDGGGTALYVGGYFGMPAHRIAKWDGSTWSDVGGGIGGTVRAMTVFDEGSGPALLAGGAFFDEGGVHVSSVARWDGQDWSMLGSAFGGVDFPDVYSLTVYDDGSGLALYAGGEFTTAGGVTANRIAKWDGSSWSALGSGVNGGVHALMVHDDGTGPALYAGGRFSSAGGVTANRIARWDGSSWSSLGTGISGPYPPYVSVTALAVFDDGTGSALYVGGSFTTAGGVASTGIARWDGSSWSALGNGTAGPVFALAVFDDGAGPELHVGGNFTSASGVSASYIAKWNGLSWSALDGGLDGNVLALTVLDDGSGSELFAGGVFSSAGGLGVSQIAKWDGSSWSALGSGLNGTVRALKVLDDGNGPALYAGGDFTGSGGTGASRVGKWDGSSWSALGSGVSSSQVYALEAFDDGGGPALYAGGGFSVTGGVTVNRIAKWDGSSWSALGTGMYGRAVWVLEAFDDGMGSALYAGGDFTLAGGAPANYVARWDGSSWSVPGGGMNAAVRAFAVHDDGSGPALYAGGSFTVAGGVPASYIARWNGSSWSPVGTGTTSSVFALAVFGDGGDAALYAGGGFTGAGGVPANYIARWDGSSWSALGSGTNSSVFALTELDHGSGSALYAGGSFTIAGGLAVDCIARWDGSSWSALGSGVGGVFEVPRVYALTVFDDGSGPALHVGGSFTSAFDSGDSYLAKWGWSEDLTAPTLSCPSAVLVGDRIGTPPGEIVTFSVMVSDCRDPSPLVVCVPPSGSVFSPGKTLVTCTATDASGNQATCRFPVTVARGVRPP